MQPCTPQQPAAGSGPNATDAASGLGPGLAPVVAGARRRAQRDADRHIDTAHLLHALLESDPEVRAVFGDAQPARLLGYLVQRSIGYGLRWQGAVEDSGAVPVVTEGGWSPAATAAMEYAAARAARRGECFPRGVDLLAGLVAHPGSRASEVLGHAGVDARRLLARVEAGDGPAG
ncbi:Clp protease N-terminal domain-containing protein [Streptomyces minutiscleroticus]|uniref:Clp protease N-terminal domain-containing protein n=1 Tax=Streptomyces minutiscleroticus TaxID=68238 RepID=UPI001E3B9A80|nr:Clp protease N-terminal domain-containing protein [Streptomyces minutiscleroticus]